MTHHPRTGLISMYHGHGGGGRFSMGMGECVTSSDHTLASGMEPGQSREGVHARHVVVWGL